MSSVFDDPHIQEYMGRQREISALHAQQEQAEALQEQAAALKELASEATSEAKRKNDLLEKILEQMENMNTRIVALESNQPSDSSK